jgi:hypothetical protein
MASISIWLNRYVAKCRERAPNNLKVVNRLLSQGDDEVLHCVLYVPEPLSVFLPA